MTTFSEPTATLLARISDNVLDDEDWPIRKLTINQVGTVLAVEDVFAPYEGKYAMDRSMPLVGWTIEELQRWASHDSTGEHPEVAQEFNTPTGTYYSGTYRPHMMQKLVRHAFDTEGWVIVQPWGVAQKDVCGYTLHNSNVERLRCIKSDDSRMSSLRPTRTPYLMPPGQVSTLRETLIQMELPTASRKECV